MKKSESIVELSKAMAMFQKEVEQPFKDASNPFFKSKYVPLENVVDAIQSIAPEHGLSFIQSPLNDENGRVGVKTLLMHESGEWMEFPPVFFDAEKQTPQGYGALITYIKRYTLSAIFGITSDQDDDGNESSKNEALATDSQLNFINRILDKNVSDKYTKEQLYAGLKKRLKTTSDMENWTSSQASQAIKILKGDSK